MCVNILCWLGKKDMYDYLGTEYIHKYKDLFWVTLAYLLL